MAEVSTFPKLSLHSRAVFRRIFMLALAAVAVVVALYTTFLSFRGILTAYHPIPVLDQWETVGEVQRFFAGTYRLRDLWAQHNEHRILFPRLLFYLDYGLFSGQNVLLLVSTVVIQALHVALLGWLMHRAAPISLGWRVVGLGVIVTCLFSPRQLANFIWAFQVQFVMVFWATTLAFAALVACRRALDGVRRGPVGLWLGFALGAATVANYSMANGLLVWPVLVGFALWLRLPGSLVRVMMLVATLCVGVYLWGYRSTGADPLAALGALPQVILYAAIYLGGPVGLGVAAAALFGFLGLIGTLFIVAYLLRHPKLPYAQGALACVLVFIVLSAVVTGLGRTGLGYEQALSGRYATPPLIFWASLMALTLACAYTNQDRNWPPPVRLLSMLVVVVVGLVVARQEVSPYSLAARVERQDVATLALLVGVFDPPVLQAVYPWPGRVLERAPVLREHRLSVFADSRASDMGATLTERFAILTPETCAGVFDAVSPLVSEQPGVAVRGWAWDRQRGQAFEEIIIVDRQDRIVGLARGGVPRADVPAALPFVTQVEVGWEGYSLVGEGAIRAYAVRQERDTVCPLGHEQTAETFWSTSPTELAAPVELLADMQGGWSLNGYHPATPPAPVEGPVYGSYSDSDENVGTLYLGPFSASEPQALGIPTFTGPSGAGLSLKLIHAETGEVFQALESPRPFGNQWHVVRFDLGQEMVGLLLEVVAEDQGAGWGQWLAVATPHWIDGSQSEPSPTNEP